MHEPTDAEIERQLAIQDEIARLDYQASIQLAADHVRFQQEIGLAACKSTILVNGGAIIGLLTFVGNKQIAVDALGLKMAFGGFSLGIAFTLMSLWLGYIAQNWMADYRTSVAWNYQQDLIGEPRVHDIDKERKWAWRLMLLASSLVSTGIGSFVVCAYFALNAIL